MTRVIIFIIIEATKFDLPDFNGLLARIESFSQMV